MDIISIDRLVTQALCFIKQYGWHITKRFLPLVLLYTTVSIFLLIMDDQLRLSSSGYWDVDYYLILTISFIVLILFLEIKLIRNINAVLDGAEGDTIPTEQFFFPYLLLTILQGLAIVGGLLLLIVPGIAAFVLYVFAPMGLLLERKGIIDSFRWSYRLVRGSFFPILFRILVIAFLSSIVYFIPEGIKRIIPSSDATILVLSILGGILGYIAALWRVTADLILYRSVKKAKTLQSPLYIPPAPQPPIIM